MSVELIGVVIAAFAVLVTLGIGMFAGFAWIVRRIDRVDDKLSSRIDAVEAGLSEVKAELTEVKIAIARFEGPRPHLVVAR